MTKRDRRKNPSSYFNDSQFEEFKENLEIAINDLKWYSSKGKEIVFPSGGLGTGKAELASKAPKIFAYLNQRLLEEFGFDNVKGELVNDIITNQDKGDDNGPTRLQDNDKTISEGVSTRDKPRSTYSSRERESRISDKQRDKTYQRGRFKRIREELFPKGQETKRGSIFRYYSSKVDGITEEEVERYLASIFPNSKIKDILFHGTSFVFDKFDSKFLDRQRKDQSESKEILDSSLAFFVTDDIVIINNFIFCIKFESKLII